MAGIIPVAARPPRPLLIYDGDCTFCRYWVRRWHQTAGTQFDILSSQEAIQQGTVPECSPEALSKEVHLVEPDGQVRRGAEAVFRALGLEPGYGWLRRLYESVPPWAALTEAVYRLIANHRGIFSRLTRIFWGVNSPPPTFIVTRWLFLRGMALVYLVAFWSLWSQIDGLVGSRGIMPVADQLSAMQAQAKLNGIGPGLYWLAPTFSWLSASDSVLWWQCLLGVVLACSVLLGFLTGPCLLLLWMIYLSLTTACGVFLGYQWDNLLLETGLLSLLVAPWGWIERWRTRPPPLGRWLLLLLLFRLMFSSGYVKLASGDLAWKGLSALQHHYQTQPIPTWIGWYTHQLPAWTHQACALVMFAIELMVPFFIFGPRRLRLAAFWAFFGFMILIGLTGNYGYFNLIAIVLCLWLVDDYTLLRLVPGPWREKWRAGALAFPRLARPWPWWEMARRATLGVAVAAYLLLSTVLITGLTGHPWPRIGLRLAQYLMPLRSINHYGLFAVMTTKRPEIIVEGSQDGRQWIPYEFKFKAGDPKIPPAFAGFHMPRLDWQMWFAALEGDYRRNSWFIGFVGCLLEGSPTVLELLERDPFPRGPPRYLRAKLYEYRYTTRDERARTDAWWERQLVGEYCPAISMKGARE